jgi:heptosyltransferase-1
VASPDLSSARRLLIVKLSALGDVVHALPVASALHESFPSLEVDWVVEPLAAPVLMRCPAVSHVRVAVMARRSQRFTPRALSSVLALARGLRERRYDVALDLQGLSKSAVLAWASGAKVRLGYDWLRELAPLLVRRVPRRTESVHIVDQLLDVARSLGAETTPVRFPIAPTADDEKEARAMLTAAGLEEGAPFLILNPTDGGGGGGKGLPPATMAEVMDQVSGQTGLRWVLIGAPGDRRLAEAALTRTHARALDLVGRTTIQQTAAVIRLATLHLSGDTGTAHIAAALGTTPVSVHGRSNPDRVGPYGYRHLVVDARRHCSERCRRYQASSQVNGPSVCRDGSARCMLRVKGDEVASAVLRALSE